MTFGEAALACDLVADGGDADATDRLAAVVGVPDTEATTIVLTRLTPKTAYTVAVRASDGSGNTVTYRATVAFTTLPAIVVDPLPR